MHKEILVHSPALMLPLAALLLFVAIFVLVVIRTMSRKAEAYAHEESLPLEDGHDQT